MTDRTFPVAATNLSSSSSLAGLTLFCVTGRCYGDDDDTSHHYWAASTADAETRFRYDMLSDAGLTDAGIQERVAQSEQDDRKPWGFITGCDVIATVNAEGTEVTFAANLLA